MSSTASAETYRDGHSASRGVKLGLPEIDTELQTDVNVGPAGQVELREGEASVVAEPLVPPVEDGQDVPEGIHDPVFPVVVLGMITLIAILATAATLAL